MRHHPSCPEGAHVHSVGPTLMAFCGWMVFVDRDAVLLTDDELVAQRAAELINTHGLADVPDRIPDDVLWGPPHPDDALIDFRLPPDPREQP